MWITPRIKKFISNKAVIGLYIFNGDFEKHFSNIQKSVSCKIVLYNFSKLGAGYAFSSEIVKKLTNEFGTEAFVGMKDSTGNSWKNLKIKNFSMLVGSEIDLLKNLSLGGTGCISATTQICPSLTRRVFEKKDQNDLKKCALLEELLMQLEI